MKTIPQDVLAALDAAEKNGNEVRLVGQLERKLYTAVNKVLEAAGGKWSRKAAAHVFPGDAADALEPLILTGEYATPKQDFGQFDTPPDVAARVAFYADVEPNMTVLEPSAGIGNLAAPIVEAVPGIALNLVAVEMDRERLIALGKRFPEARTIHTDFMARSTILDVAPPFANDRPMLFDRVVMNPPFAKGADIAHVRHAYDFLKPGGRLVAITSTGWRFRKDRKFVEFHEWATGLTAGWYALPEGAFKSSGTNVATGILVIDKPHEAA